MLLVTVGKGQGGRGKRTGGGDGGEEEGTHRERASGVGAWGKVEMCREIQRGERKEIVSDR